MKEQKLIECTPKWTVMKRRGEKVAEINGVALFIVLAFRG